MRHIDSRRLPKYPPRLDDAYVAWVRRRLRSGLRGEDAVRGLQARKSGLSEAEASRLLNLTQDLGGA